MLRYVKAPIPDSHYLDTEAKEIQETVAWRARTSQELYDADPMFVPQHSFIVGVLNETPGQRKLRGQSLCNALPTWGWSDISTMGLSMAEGLSVSESMAKLEDVKVGTEEV